MEKGAYKLIVPKNNELNTNFGYATWLEFAFCSLPNNKNEITLLTRFNRCRESATGNVWAYFNPDRLNFGRCIPLIKKIKFNKTRLLIRQVVSAGSDADNNYNSVIECGIKIVNILETKYGWRISKSKSVKLVNSEKYAANNLSVHMTFVEGDDRWVQSPQMLTFYMLLLRSGQIPEMLSVKTFDDLQEIMKTFNKTRSGDKYYFRTALKFIDVIMKRHKNLFGAMADNYDPKFYNGQVRLYEGINELCVGKTYNTFMHNKFVDLAKEEKIKNVKRNKR
jgi:hypothetical protein